MAQNITNCPQCKLISAIRAYIHQNIAPSSLKKFQIRNLKERRNTRLRPAAPVGDADRDNELP